mmetsp:Transcript_26295/g.84369  ORF Transcript_26295/g.84369 Transcript_26295/m.84369 type:complete len:86 (-) Transcript_26295:427-684(-)
MASMVPGDHDDVQSVDASSMVEEEETPREAREQLAMIKARTMFQMVEEIKVGATDLGQKLLFLTNPQAELLASSESSIQKMLDAL